MRSGVLSAAFALLAGAAFLVTPNEAFAWCHATTCTCKASEAKNGESNPCKDQCPTDEHGCKITGEPVGWTGSCIGYSLDVRGTESLSADQLTDAITQAFLAWGAADCGGGKHPSIDVRQLRDVSCGANEYDPNGPNANVVYFEDSGWDGRDLDHTLALTTTHYSHETGEIYDADMAINSGVHDFSVGDGSEKHDLISVVTHEVGHFLGLDHSDVAESVMYWQQGPGEIKRKLTKDDIKGICTLYPPGRDAECDPTPKNGLKATCAEAEKPSCSAAGTARAERRDPSGVTAIVCVGFVSMLAAATLRRRRRR